MPVILDPSIKLLPVLMLGLVHRAGHAPQSEGVAVRAGRRPHFLASEVVWFQLFTRTHCRVELAVWGGARFRIKTNSPSLCLCKVQSAHGPTSFLVGPEATAICSDESTPANGCEDQDCGCRHFSFHSRSA